MLYCMKRDGFYFLLAIPFGKKNKKELENKRSRDSRRRLVQACLGLLDSAVLGRVRVHPVTGYQLTAVYSNVGTASSCPSY